MANYYTERTKTLIAQGFTGLTREQEDVIMEPSEAPENYYCDGEITPAQAKQRWITNLKNSGLDVNQIAKAVKLMLR